LLLCHATKDIEFKRKIFEWEVQLFDWKENSLFRRFSYILAGLAALVAVFWLALPSLISTELVRERFELEISNSIGQDVKFGNNPKFTLWPTANIQLDNVIVADNELDDEGSLLQAESFSADVSLLSTLLGEPHFSNYKLVRPTVRIEIYPNGSSNWSPASNIIRSSIDNAIQDGATTQLSNVQSGIPLTNSQFLNFGNIQIEGGTVQLITNPGSDPERITAINGNINWPDIKAPIAIDVDAIFRGERVNLNIVNQEPLAFLDGGSVAIGIGLQSALVNFDFDGDIEVMNTIFVDGKLSLDTPSVRRALEWSGNQIKPSAALGAVELSAEISGDMSGAKLDDLVIKIGENRGVGIVDLSVEENAPPIITGTLAFNSLNISSFLRAFTPLPKSSEDLADTIDTRFLKQLGLDLRLSAQTASFGPVDMSNLAAGVQVNKQDATFNVGAASAYGGQLNGKISISERGIDGGGEISVSARGINFGDLYSNLEILGPLPIGIGDLDVKLLSNRPLWATVLNDIKGDINISVKDGTIPNLSLSMVKQFGNEQQFFNLSDVANGQIDFQLAELSTSIERGVARLNTAQVQTPNETVTFSGIVPFAKGSFAVFGTILDKAEPLVLNLADPNAVSPSLVPTLQYFIGGSWPNPVISQSVSRNDLR
jgi:AsmA protein